MKKTKIIISLPDMDTAIETGAHPYPFQIAKQTETFIVASIWHTSFLDIAAGRYIRLPWGLWQVRKMFNITDSAWKRGLNSFLLYRQVFEKSVLQTVVISMKSHWDWFITKIAGFIIFSYNHETNNLNLDHKTVADLKSIGQNKPIKYQISLLSKITNIDFLITETILNDIYEMTLVRNLGIHNRWEVDLKYLEKTQYSENWELGELRTINANEVELWERSLFTIIRNVAFPIAFKYGNTPNYP